MIQSRTVTLNGVAIHYAEAPGPSPALVIAHGLSGSHAEFLHLVPELAKQAHVYLIDLRGHGLSGRAESYQVADYTRDVAAFVRQVVSKPVVLVGHSLGGLIAIWLAAHQPDLLRGMVLVDPGLYLLEGSRFAQSEFGTYFAGLYNYLARYHANGASLDDMIAYVGQSPLAEDQVLLDVAGLEAVQERAVQLHQLDPAALEPALAGALLGAETVDSLLARVRCPVHLLAAQVELGGALPIAHLQRVVARVPHCTHTVIEDAGHDIHLAQPAAFLREVTRFAQAVTA